jgi:hypothetical protein
MDVARSFLLGLGTRRAMRWVTAVACAAGTLAWIIAHRRAWAHSESISPYRVAAIRAYLFNAKSGELSGNVVPSDPGQPIANRGSAETLVVTEIEGRPGSYDPSWKIHLLASREDGRVLLDKTVSLRVFSPTGRYFAPFLVYDTECVQVNIKASVFGRTDTSTMERSLLFECGE